MYIDDYLSLIGISTWPLKYNVGLFILDILVFRSCSLYDNIIVHFSDVNGLEFEESLLNS